MAHYEQRPAGMTLREVSNNLGSNWNKDRHVYPSQSSTTASLSQHTSGDYPQQRSTSGSVSARNRYPSVTRFSSGSVTASPGFDRQQRANPPMCGEIAGDIVDMFHVRERAMVRDSNYLSSHPEVTEKMRTILVDWLVDVHLKFRLHPETLFLAVDIVDRYLATTKVSRSQLQLVGITAILLSAKYEEIWPPEVKECLHISANTYQRDELLRMERAVCAALQFKLTVPTCYPFLVRLLETTESDDTTRHAALYFMEYAMQDYKHLQYLPSQIANASMYLANVLLRKSDPWNFTLQHYSRSRFSDFSGCAGHILEYMNSQAGSKYQAIKRKYSSSKLHEVARLALPAELPCYDL